jgi:hypothetical protein
MVLHLEHAMSRTVCNPVIMFLSSDSPWSTLTLKVKKGYFKKRAMFTHRRLVKTKFTHILSSTLGHVALEIAERGRSHKGQ